MQQVVAKPSALDRKDAEWLQAVATRRDRGSFDQLFARHERAAYSLALHITNHPEAAEETVQEAMLKVWTSASSFRAEGTVRSWLLRIVARESIKALKSARRNKPMELNDIDVASNDAPITDDAAAAELSAALRDRMQALPPLERQLMGLHYGGGLTQQEISEALSIPQQTISYRLGEALKGLRASLKTAGFAAAVPLLESGKLGDVLCSGAKIPPGLRGRVLDGVTSRAAGKSLRNAKQSVRKVRHAASNGAMGWVVGGVVMTAAVSIIVINQRSAAKPVAPVVVPAPVPVPAPASEPVAATPAAAKPNLMTDPVKFVKEYHLVFDKKPSQDIIDLSVNDKWRWSANDQAMVSDTDKGTHFILPLELGAYPVKITVVMKFADIKKTMNFAVQLYGGSKELPPVDVWKSHKNMSSDLFTEECYISGPYLMEFIDGEPRRVAHYPENHEKHVPTLFLHNLMVKEIHLTHITDPKDLPDKVKDPMALTVGLTKSEQN